MSKEESNSYSKVIFKQDDDEEAKKMVNSYRFKSPSPHKYRVWSPEISQEERFKKKREREDDYVNKFDSKDRPILVIKKKHAYKGLNNINVMNDDEKDDYYKISENTNIIDDVSEELQAQREFIRKHTVMHNKKINLKDKNDENSLYKIQGIEFLPEGFLELDPLLYRDEFEFESKVHEKFFSDEQRKIKALRRKQYEQKNFQKMRDVTIYLLDERKDKIVDYLERWYFKNKRVMNKKEILYVADLLKCDPKTMCDLQELFLEKKKYLNTKRLRQYLTKHGRLQNDKIVVPSSLKPYFIKSKDPYSHIEAKVYDNDHPGNKKYNFKPSKEKRFKKKNNNINKEEGHRLNHNNNNNEDDYNINNNVFGNNALNDYRENLNKNKFSNDLSDNYNNMNNRFSKTQENRVFSNNQDEYKKNQFSNTQNSSKKFTNNKDHFLNNQNSNQFKKNQLFSNTSGTYPNQTNSDYKKSSNFSSNKRSLGLIKTSTQDESSSYYKNNDDDLRIYFDSEVNRILDGLRGNEEFREDCDVDIGTDKKIMNCKYVIKPNRGSRRIVEDFTDRLIRGSMGSNKFGSEKKIIKEQSVHMRKKKKTDVLDEIAYDVLNEDNLRPDLDITNELLRKSKAKSFKKNKSVNKEVQIEHYPEMDTFGGDKQPRVSAKILHSEVDELGNIQIIDGIIENPFFTPETVPKRVTLVCRNDKGDTKVIQKLEPILVGNEYYYQNIEDTTINGDRKVTLITKTDRGEIVNVTDIPEDDRTDNYKNEIFDEPAKFDGDKKITVVVNNDKGKSVSIQSLRPSISCIFADNNLEGQLKKGNFRKSHIVTVKKADVLKRIHSLNPLLVSGKNYHQKITEEISENGKRKITINTIDERGKIIHEEELAEVEASKSFFTQIENDYINEDGNRETSIITKNDKGETLISHTIKTSLLKESDKLFTKLNRGYRNTTMNTKKIRGKTIRSHTLKPILVGKDYFHQTVQEIIDKKGQRTLNIITKDQLGEIVNKEQTNSNFIGNGYNTEIIADTIERDGKRKITVATKNDRGETICVKSVRPTINSVLGEDFFCDFVEKSRGKSCFSIRKSVLGKKITVFELRPTIIGNQYYQQFIEASEDNLDNKKIVVFTKSQQGEIISKMSVASKDFKGKEFITEIENVQIDKKGDKLLTVVTKNEKGEEILSQKIRPTIFSVLGENYFEDFKNKSKGRNSVLNTLRHNGSIIRSQTLKPLTIENNNYQPIINEVIDKNGNKSIVVMTRNQNGDLIDAEEIDPNKKIGTNCYVEVVEKTKNRGITIVIRNEEGAEIAQQKVTENLLEGMNEDEDEEEENYKELGNFSNSVLSKISIIKNDNGNSVISHQLKPTMVGNEYYQQILNETIDSKGNKTLAIITKNLEGFILEEKSIDNSKNGLNYHSQITNDFIDDKGLRKVTVETRNDKGQTLHSIILEPELEKNKIYFDSKEMSDLNRNSIEVIKQRDGTIIKKSSIRPTIIGNEFYKHIVEEITTKNGDRKVTLITLGKDEKEIDKKEINPKFTGENYKAQIVEEVVELNGNRISTLEIRNEKNEKIASQKFFCETATNQQEYYFSDFLDIFSQNGKRESTIATKRQRNSTFKTHSLRPTLIGNQYYQQTVNELTTDENVKKGVIVTSDENGNIIDTREIEEELMGEFYTNEVKGDEIGEDGNRVIRFEIKNDRGETISVQSIRPSLDFYLSDDFNFDNFIEEIVDDEGNKLIHVMEQGEGEGVRITQRNITKFRKTVLTPILEEDAEYSDDEGGKVEKESKVFDRNKYFEDLVEKYGFQNNIRSFSEIKNGKNRFKNNTIHSKGYQVENGIIINYAEGVQLEPEKYLNEGEDLGIEFEQREKKSTMKPEKPPTNISTKKYKKFSTTSKKSISKKSISNKNINKKNSLNSSLKESFAESERKLTIIENPENSKIDKFEQEQSIKDSNVIEDSIKDPLENSSFHNLDSFRTKTQTEYTNTPKQDALTQINKEYQNITNSISKNFKKSEIVEEKLEDEEDQLLLIQKSQRLKGYLDDYINTINSSKIKKDDKKEKIKNENEDFLRKTVEEVFRREKEKLSEDIVERLGREVRGGGRQGDLMDEFYEFCRSTLPHDQKYKESIMFVSLFYYFLEKKKVIK